MADQKWYDEGLRPRVSINWQSFVDRGIANNWQDPFTDACIASRRYARLQVVR